MQRKISHWGTWSCLGLIKLRVAKRGMQCGRAGWGGAAGIKARQADLYEDMQTSQA